MKDSTTQKNHGTKVGVVHGRFQIFHNGHLEYALQAYAKCDHLVVGITNPDPELIKYDETNPNRSKDENNPFSYYERYLMIKESLLLAGVPFEKFEIVPFPINFPERIKYYVPENATHYTRIFEDWNYKKLQLLKDQGFKVEVLFEGTETDKQYIGTKIRKAMIFGENWEDYVPEGTTKVIKEFNLISKLK